MVVCPSPHRPHPYIPSPFLHVSPLPPPHLSIHVFLTMAVYRYRAISLYRPHLYLHTYLSIYRYISADMFMSTSIFSRFQFLSPPLLTFICIHLRVIVINIAYALHPHITPNLDRATVQSVYTLSYLFFPSYLASIISHASVPVTIFRLSAVALPCSLVSLCSPLAPLLVNRRGGFWNLILASMA